MAHAVRKIQQRLAPDVDVDDYVLEWMPRRPRGMRKATYRRLVDKAWRLIEKRDDYLEPQLLRVLTRCMKFDTPPA